MTRRRAAVILTGAALVAGACSLPPVDLEGQKPLALRSTITSATGSRLARLFKENRGLTSIDVVPQSMLDAVLAAEDARFFAHDGYDVRAIVRAALVNWKTGEVAQGGSTITQQYVKNTFFRDPGETLERKARELRLAVEVEKRYSKREILERYLNTVYFGEGAYGVRAAAETFFGHGVRELSLPESALLAAIIKSPANYDPRDHPRLAKARRNYVLGRMSDLDFVSVKRSLRAQRRPLGAIARPPLWATHQPYFVEAVKREVLDDPRLGATPLERERALWKGGLRIRSTLQPDLQKAAQGAAESVLNEPGDPEVAIIAIRPSNGEIVAMVGGRDWSESQVNLALGVEGGGSGRQPGSSFKPIVAATALEAGRSLDDTFESGPARFSFPDGSSWTVQNAEGGSYGSLSLHEAMVHSVNGVYARLAIDLGAGQIATQAQLMGVHADLPAYPSIALGSAEVSVLDMASAYSVLANNGTAIEPTTIRSIRFANGEVIKPIQEKTAHVVAPGNAYLVTSALQDVIRRGTGRAAYIGRPAAGKTGTTNDYADAWFVGYTPDLVAAVWVGYPEGRIPMLSVHGTQVLGGTYPAVIWRSFMLEALRGLPPRNFKRPASDLVRVSIDPGSGLLAASWCPGEYRTMLRQLVPTEYCPEPVPEPVPTLAPVPPPSPAPEPEVPEPTPSSTPVEPSPEPTPEPEPEPEPTPEPSSEPEPTPAPSPSASEPGPNPSFSSATATNSTP